MTRLNVEPAAPSVRRPEPASSSTAGRGENDLLTIFDTHLQRAQTPEPINKLRPKAPDFGEPAHPSAEPHRPQKPNEPTSSQRDDRRRDEINERDDGHDESTQPVASEQQVVTAAESSGDERHEDLNEPTAGDTQHDTEDGVEAQVVIDEAEAADDLSALTAHQGEPSGDPTYSTENDGNDSPGDESAAEGIGSGRPRMSYGNDALNGKDATTEDPVSFDEIDPIAGDTDAVTDAAADAETDAATAQRVDDENDRQGRRASGVAEQARRDTSQSRFSDRADTESSDTGDPSHDTEASAETEKPAPDDDNPQQGRPRRQNATHPSPQHGPQTPAMRQEPAADATSLSGRAALAAAAQTFTHEESGQQSVIDSTSQSDEAAAAGGDTPTDARSRGNPQDARAELPPQLRARFGSSGEPASSDGLSGVQRARFMQRVGNAFRMASERGGVVRLRLSPVELGSLRLEIAMRDGMMTARMEVETSQARSTIVDNLGMLRQRLAEHNVEIERFDVEVRDQGAGATPEQNDRSMAFGDNRQNNGARGNNTDGNDSAQDSQEPRMARRLDDNSQLNLLI